MARYIAEDKKIIKTLQSSKEEEEINRRLKGSNTISSKIRSFSK